jgi:flagellar motor switch protein FliM
MADEDIGAVQADAAPGDAASAISEEEVSALLEKTSTGKVRPYDFMAQRINQTQLPMLEIVSKSFADRMGASLSGLLGRDATVQFTALDSAKAGELQAA